MKEELSLREIIYKTILFFINYRIIILSITIMGTFSAILFQKFRPAYYESVAIATSGISEFERIQDLEEVLNQRTAINFINNLQLDVKKNDYSVVAERLNISIDDAKQLIDIEANQIFGKNKEGKEFNTPKFEISILVKDNQVITLIQEGLYYYFNSSKYINDYYNTYLTTNKKKISSISQEIKEFKSLRSSVNNLEMNPVSIALNKDNRSQSNNQIVNLIDLMHISETNQKLLKPISFVKDFSKTTVPEREVLLVGSFSAIFSFVLSIIVALFVYVYKISRS